MARTKGTKGRDEASFWFWLFALFVEALPCIGLVMVLIWAFAGKSASVRNYFRARLAWAAILAILWGVVIFAGQAPQVKRELSQGIRRALGQAK